MWRGGGGAREYLSLIGLGYLRTSIGVCVCRGGGRDLSLIA